MPDRTFKQQGRAISCSGVVNTTVKPAGQAPIDNQATAEHGKSRSEFMPAGARGAAQKALLDRILLCVDEATHDRFVELLDAPPRPNEELCRLMQTKAPWDQPDDADGHPRGRRCRD